jgi:hypothetical protein
MKIKKFFIISIIASFCFIAFIAYLRLNSKDLSLKRESSIDINITSISKDKGLLILNDSIAMFEQTPRLKNYRDSPKIQSYKYLKNIRSPFRLIKKKDSDTIKVITKNDEIIYFLINTEE